MLDGGIARSTNKMPHSGAHDVRSDITHEFGERIIGTDPLHAVDLEDTLEERLLRRSAAVMKKLDTPAPLGTVVKASVNLPGNGQIKVQDDAGRYNISGTCDSCGNGGYINDRGYCQSCDPEQQ